MMTPTEALALHLLLLDARRNARRERDTGQAYIADAMDETIADVQNVLDRYRALSLNASKVDA